MDARDGTEREVALQSRHERRGWEGSRVEAGTWNPPESVSIPRGQPMKSWSPFISATSSLPGLLGQQEECRSLCGRT